MRRNRLLPTLVLASSISAWVPAGRADYRDDVGYTQLAQELGTAMFTGAGVSATQVEAPEGSAYAPDTSTPELAGKAYTFKSGTGLGSSGHATAVAQNFYGSSTSFAPAVNVIDLYSANNWISSGMLNTGGGTPKAELRDVANFSFIGDGTQSEVEEITRRFDYTIDVSNYVAVVGTNNGASTSVPLILAHNYNGITVGRSDGQHAAGFTTMDGAGRIKPEIVAPPSGVGGNFTSFTTPLVSGAAAGLIQVARSNAALANGADSRSIKAILLAGATKEEFSTWTRTPTQPLDVVYGAGELNVYNSYHILAAGEQSPGASATVPTQGWDLGTVTTSQDLLYYFDVPQGFSLNNFSVALTWNRKITNSSPLAPFTFTPQAFVDNLDLHLFTATGFTLGAEVDSSISSVSNVEYMFQSGLAPGRYAIELSHGTANTTFAVAWTGTLTEAPEPSVSSCLLAGASLFLRRRDRNARRLAQH